MIVLFGGCGFARVAVEQPRYYVLSAWEEAPEAGAPAGDIVLGISRIDVPAYLASRYLVVRRGEHEIRFTEFDRWGEELAAGVGRVLGENLRALGAVRAVLSPPYMGRDVTHELVLQIVRAEGRFDGDRTWVELAASWELRSLHPEDPGAALLASGRFNSGPLPWRRGDYAALAEALSASLAGLSREIAAALH